MSAVRKVFRYELRRLVCSKFYLGIAAVVLWYGWQVLNTATILGVAHTAPFSPWSFGAYLSALLPFLSAALLFFLWNQCREGARRVEMLTAATPVPPGRYLLIKSLAAAAAWLLLALAACALGGGFLAALFGGDVPYFSLIAPAAAALLPPFLLLLGAGLLAGRARPWLLALLLALALGLAYLPLPMALDPYARAFFTLYPLSLDTLDPAFCLPASVLAGRLAAAGLGALLLAAGLRFKTGARR